VFFGFRLEEFQDLVGHFVVAGQRVEIRAGGGSYNSFLGRRFLRFRVCLRLGIIQWRRLRRKRKAIAFFEGRDVIQDFFARIADLEQICFQQGNAIREKFRQRAVQIIA
jgi:hypothetical protein